MEPISQLLLLLMLMFPHLNDDGFGIFGQGKRRESKFRQARRKVPNANVFSVPNNSPIRPRMPLGEREKKGRCVWEGAREIPRAAIPLLSRPQVCL